MNTQPTAELQIGNEIVREIVRGEQYTARPAGEDNYFVDDYGNQYEIVIFYNGEEWIVNARTFAEGEAETEEVLSPDQYFEMLPEILKHFVYPEFLDECYKIGMNNGWCSGRYAIQDGDFITPEDRFNRDKFTVFTNLDKLEAEFDHGNWCLGEAFVYGDLCFINQIDGGDEWLTIKRFETGARAFESITMKAYTKDGRFKDLIQRLEAAHMTEDDRVEY